MERGLRNLGVNPDEKVGYVHHGIHPKQRISDKIVALRKARNEKAAHGRIHADRKSTYYEICDFQALAKSFLLLHLRHKYPDVGI
jgi:beta-galactosidase beta subunit